MNEEEYELLEYIFQLAYRSAYSEEIKEISDLENKIIKKLENEDKAIEYIDLIRNSMCISEDYVLTNVLEILKGDNNE